MTKTLQFATTIAADRARVWDVMLHPDTYRAWTEEFAEGSYYEGSWERGERIRFLAPDGSGMVSVIAESRRPEFVSIRHLGTIDKGVEDTESEEVRRWAPAYENYTLIDRNGSTDLEVALDVTPDFEEYMTRTWPKALARLKELCEGRS